MRVSHIVCVAALCAASISANAGERPTQSELAWFQARSIFHSGIRDAHTIALTFDDGPNANTGAVLDVLKAIRGNFSIGNAFMAEEFRAANQAGVRAEFEQALKDLPVVFEPHADLKKRVPLAIGLIRTGDTVQYANMILESA